VANGINMAKIKGNLRKMECDSRNKMKVARMYHFCGKGKLSMQLLKRPTNASLIRIGHITSEESLLD